MTDKALPVHALMDQFAVQHGELLVGGVPHTRLAARVGPMPFYAVDRSLLTVRVAQLRAALPQAVSLHSAIEANPMPALVQHMAGLVGPGRGLRRRAAGGPERRHACARHQLRRPRQARRGTNPAAAACVPVNVESLRELPAQVEASQRLCCPARVNPDFELKSSGMKMSGGPKQFGIDLDTVPDALARIRQLDLSFKGFYLYAGLQDLRADSMVETQRGSWELALRVAEYAHSPVKKLNFGDGFCIPYFPGARRLDLAHIGGVLAGIAHEATLRIPGAELVVELGNYLVGEAGVYVCRVIDHKVSRGQVFLVTDGGLHHHLAASGNFGQVLRKNYSFAVVTRADAAAAENAMVVGPLCTRLDMLGAGVSLPAAEVDDLVGVFQAGVYGAIASPQGFLGHPAVTEVLV